MTYMISPATEKGSTTERTQGYEMAPPDDQVVPILEVLVNISL